MPDQINNWESIYSPDLAKMPYLGTYLDDYINQQLADKAFADSKLETGDKIQNGDQVYSVTVGTTL